LGEDHRKAIRELGVLCGGCQLRNNCSFYCGKALVVLEDHKLYNPHPTNSTRKQEKEIIKESCNTTKLIREALNTPLENI